MEDVEAKKRKMDLVLRLIIDSKLEDMEAKKRKMEMEEAREDSEIEWEDCVMEAKKGKMEEGGWSVCSDPPPQVARICIHCSRGGLRSYLRKDEFEGSTERACTLCSKPFRVLSWKDGRGNDMYAQVCYKCGSDSSMCQFCASVHPHENLRFCYDEPRPLQPIQRRMPFLRSSLPKPYDFNVKFGLEKTSGSRLCNTCSGETTNSYSRVDIHYKQCITCAKPFLIRYWRPPRRKGSPDNSKKAVVCYACSLQHNTCQFCASPTDPGKLMHYPSAQLGPLPRFSFTKNTSVPIVGERKMIIPAGSCGSQRGT